MSFSMNHEILIPQILSVLQYTHHYSRPLTIESQEIDGLPGACVAELIVALAGSGCHLSGGNTAT